MNTRVKVVLGSLVGALSVHGALIACGGSSHGGSGDMSDAFVDAILDAVSMEASEAAADDRSTSASALVASTVTIGKVGASSGPPVKLLDGPVVVTDLVSPNAVEVFIGEGTCDTYSGFMAVINVGVSQYSAPVHGARMYLNAGQVLCAKTPSGSTVIFSVSSFGFRPGP
jgi:hypothetical protein